MRLELPAETAAGLYYVVRTLGERLGLVVRPHCLRHASITVALRVAAERGIPLPEVLPTSGHAAGSVRVVLGYFDPGPSQQGELARHVAQSLGHGGRSEREVFPPWESGEAALNAADLLEPSRVFTGQKAVVEALKAGKADGSGNALSLERK